MTNFKSSAGSTTLLFSRQWPVTNRNSPDSQPSPGADWVSGCATPLPSPPSNELVQEKLSKTHAMSIGTQYGAAFAAIAALPIWAVEQFLKKDNFLSSIAKPRFPDLSRHLARPYVNVAASVVSTIGVGGTMGFFLGWMLVGDVRKRFLEINAVRQAQAQGHYTQRQPNLLSRIGLHPKPVTDPDQSYYDLIENTLNPKTAFWHGVVTILVLKLIKGVILPATTFGLGTTALKLVGYPQLAKRVRTLVIRELKHWMQPVVIAKLALAPLMGGLIAQQLAPWMKRKLEIN